MPSCRVLVLALDAAEPALLRRWSASGELPVLRRLLQSGSAGRLATPAQQFPDMAFFSAYTGLGAASLGRYFFIQPQPGTTRLEMLGHRLPAGEPFWVTAGRHGRRCIAIDTPKLGLHPPADGIHLVGWGIHGSSPPLASHPAAVAPALLARFGAYPLENCDDHGRGAAGYGRMLRRLLEGIETRRRLLLDLMRATRWDLFVAAFAETHCVGHQFWHFLAAAEGGSGHAGGPVLEHAVRDVYAAVDRAVGDLIDAAGAETRVVLFSSQGMRPQNHGRDLVPTL